MSKSLNIALAQINPVVGDLTFNADKIIKAWENISGTADLAVFPELALCGYIPEDLILKPFFRRQIEKMVQEIAGRSAEFAPAALIGCPWEIDGHIYNAVHLIEKGEIAATRLKHRLPNYDVFDEKRMFEAGPLPEPVNFRGMSLGVMICEDMWSDAVAGHLKGRGAEVLVVINASPFDTGNIFDRREQARQRTQETGLPLLYVNQVGGQDELVFDGASFVMDQSGETVLQMPGFEEDINSITLPLTLPLRRSLPLPPGEDDPGGTRGSGEGLLYKALCLGLRDYIRKNSFPGVLIGISGGVDSALSAAIAVDALGAENIHGVMMPSRFTSKESLEDAEALARNLGIRLDTIPVEEPVQAFRNILKPELPEQTPETTFENLQSRARGIILMALSNATGKMVLSTGNKSEMATGYATLYGDMCGGFNVLKDVYKTQVYELSRWRNAQGPAIPERTLTRAPTAELRENQTDQDTLPPYGILDDILRCLVEENLGVDEIAKRGHDRKAVVRVWTMLDRAEYKRRQAPPGVKISPRAFGRDRRYPITNHFVNIIEKSGS